MELSNLVILEEQQKHSRTSSTPPQKTRVHFAAADNLVTMIREEDIKVELPPPPKRKSRKNKKKKEGAEQSSSSSDHEHSSSSDEEREVSPLEIWWSKDELESIEQNATYMVKESQQYQEEVICTVLYNKAFLSAAELSKTLEEDQLLEQLQDVSKYSNTLEKWTTVGNSRRGLENRVSEKASLDAINSRMMVLNYQKELKEQHEGELLAQQHSDFLAKRCQDTSRTARIMARMMGQSDADSLEVANKLCEECLALPEPPGRYSGDHEFSASVTSQRVGSPQRTHGRRGSLIKLGKSVKNSVRNVFRRQSSVEADIKRIRKIQQKQWAEQSPPKRPSEEFRRSFLESLDYGEQ